MRNLTRIGLLSVIAVVGLSSQAQGAAKIGSTFTPTGGCEGDFTVLQTTSPGDSYTVQSPGVLTSWKHLGSEDPPDIGLVVGRPAGPSAPNDFTIIGQSPVKSPVQGPNTYTDLRIPVIAGDVLGLNLFGPGQCGTMAPGYGSHQLNAPPPSGQTTFEDFSDFEYKFDVAATLEADADGDGYGDGTQDPCPGVAGLGGPCPLDTKITKHPKKKTTKKRAKFKFTSKVPGATFECSVDGKKFKNCKSPLKVKVGKGKHSFEVRAVQAGTRDATPASYKWKVKKKHG